MRKNGSVCDFIAERNRELQAAFYERLGSSNYKNIRAIFADIATIPASRFYISETRAIELLKYKQRFGRFPADMMRNRLSMIEEIERRVDRLLAADTTLSFTDAVYAVVNSQAPTFYLTPRSVRTILYSFKAASLVRALRS